MKFLELSHVIRTNRLFEKLKEIDPRQSVDIEVYSCKQTKRQKAHRHIPKPYRFYVAALELAFPDYFFSGEDISSFKLTSFENIKKELSYTFFTIYRNCGDVADIIQFVEMILQQCVNLDRTLFYVLDDCFEHELGTHKVFILHDRKARRVMIIKSLHEK